MKVVPGFIGKYSLSIVVVNSAGLMWGVQAFCSCEEEPAHPATSASIIATMALNTVLCPTVVNHLFMMALQPRRAPHTAGAATPETSFAGESITTTLRIS